MEIITIDRSNIDSEHICCAIGNDKENQKRAASKKEWMKERFSDGLVFKRFDTRGKIFIEYIPVEKSWKPVTGKDYMMINCLWVSGQFKGKGLSTLLLEECLKDAKLKKMNGAAVVCSSKSKPFMTDKSFYLKHGFEVADSAPPYFELLVLKFKKNADVPEFSAGVKAGAAPGKKGLTFIYSNQCPFMEEYVGIMAGVSRKRNIPYEIIKLNNYKDAQKIGSPFGTLGVYYNGEFRTHELMPEKKFEKFVDGLK